MRTIFRAQESLLDQALIDLERPHPFAAERVGWIAVKPAMAGETLLLLGYGYHPVADEHYVQDSSVGAMIGEDAITAALAIARRDRVGMFHVHSHGGRGFPTFSGVDVREYPKLVFDLLSAQRGYPHGALLFSGNEMIGRVWSTRRNYWSVDEIHRVGSVSRASFPPKRNGA